MKEKKTSVITFRCTETTKAWLEEEAERKNWTVAKLAGHIIENFANDREMDLTNDSKNIFEFAMSENCKGMSDLFAWAIENEKTGEVSRAIDLWNAIIKEKLEKQK